MQLRLIASVVFLGAVAVGPETAVAQGMPVYSWTGCYLGLEGGGNWGNSQAYYENQTFPQVVGLPDTNGIKLSGGLFGGTVGCSLHLTNWVVGIEKIGRAHV